MLNKDPISTLEMCYQDLSGQLREKHHDMLEELDFIT